MSSPAPPTYLGFICEFARVQCQVHLLLQIVVDACNLCESRSPRFASANSILGVGSDSCGSLSRQPIPPESGAAHAMSDAEKKMAKEASHHPQNCAV